MAASFQVQDVIPAIANLITARSDQSSYMTHNELVDSLLSSAEGKALVEAAASTKGWDSRRMAATMVAWFSQFFSTGRNQFSESLDRTKIDGRYAYRAKQTNTSLTASKSVPDDARSSSNMVSWEVINKAWNEYLAEEEGKTS